MKINRIALFGILVLVQLAVPGWMVVSHQRVVDQGTTYRFRVAPIDPNDPFRGKYLTLSYEDVEVPRKDTTWEQGQEVFVKIKVDEAGFATIDQVTDKPIGQGNDYVKATISQPWINFSNQVRVSYPFDRFYMDEFLASYAETEYFEASRDSTLEAYAVVKVLKGQSVLENIVIGGKSIHQLARERKER